MPEIMQYTLAANLNPTCWRLLSHQDTVKGAMLTGNKYSKGMTNKLYDENLARFRRALALEPTDRVPFIPVGSAYYAKSEGVLLKDYISDFALATDTNLKAAASTGGFDGTQSVLFTPWLLPRQWLSMVHMPGVELGEDDMWQVVEKENMMREDYTLIVDNGFEPFYEKFLAEKCGNPNKHLETYFTYLPKASQRFADAGIPRISSFSLAIPFEMFCGGRSLEHFFLDLLDIPDTVEAASKVVMDYQLKKYNGMLASAKPIGVWIGGWRSAPDMLSTSVWERFVWPYIKQFAELVLYHDVTPIFHLDSNWDRGLEYFLEMPEKKCIMALDSKTNIRLAKSLLGKRMCIMGDVPAELLAFGSPDQVSAYTKGLLHDIGMTGYILSSGCDIPSNGRKENIKAMRDAALEYGSFG